MAEQIWLDAIVEGKDAWDKILIHQLDNRFRPCNLVELMPRLREHEKD